MPRSRDSGPMTAARIVKTIWQYPKISRVGIAERLNLDKSTVTYQVNRLIEGGLIEEIEKGSASARGGRRPIYLSLSKGYGRVIGIEIQLESWIALAVDLSGEILGELRGRTRLTPENFADSVVAIVEQAKASLCPDTARLLGIGVGSAGLIDFKKSLIRFSVPLGMKGALDFGRLVAPRIPVPCLIENDANCCAWGELAFNRSKELGDFLFALVEFRGDELSLGQYGGVGVGFGIVLGGRVHPGAHGSAGEFRSVLCDGPGKLQFSLDPEELGRAGHESAVLHRVADELARNMAMLLNTMDFNRVIIGGDIEGLGVDFPAILRRRLQENWMYPVSNDVVIQYSSLGGGSVAYGAAGMILDRLLSERLLPGLGEALAPEGAGWA